MGEPVDQLSVLEFFNLKMNKNNFVGWWHLLYAYLLHVLSFMTHFHDSRCAFLYNTVLMPM